MKTQLSGLIEKTNNSEIKIQALESDIAKIKCSETRCDENIIQEIKERATREKNILIVGLKEHKEANTREAYTHDESKVLSLLKCLVSDCPTPIRMFRIGKYDRLKDRTIKVCFETSQTAKLLLRSKSKLPSDIKIFYDQTRSQ
jgi:hypothetical protein